MSRKRLALLGFIVAAALAAAGVAAAHRGAPSVQSVTATFNATTVTQHSLTTCSVNGGDTSRPRGRRTRERRRAPIRVSPAHSRFAPGASSTPRTVSATCSATSASWEPAISGPTGRSTRDRGRQRIRAGERLREGQVGPRRRIARLGVQPHDGLLLGLDRIEHRRRGLPALGSLVSPGQLAWERRRVERRPGSTGASQSRRPGPLSSRRRRSRRRRTRH
jgi:hypothetical protein